MNSRERQLAILNGEPPDRIPWAPRLDIWYNARLATGTMPAKWQGWSLRDIQHDLGCDDPAKQGQIVAVHYEGVEIVQKAEDGLTFTEYHTPVGSVRRASGHSETLRSQGMGGRVQQNLLNGPADYRVWEWVMEHAVWEPTYDAYRSYDAEVGGDGLPIVQFDYCDAPFHWFLLHGAGYGDGFYQLHDYPAEVEHLLAVMTEVQRARNWPVLAESPARVLLHGVHHSSAFTPPPLYEKYILPYYQEFIPLMHDHGKAVALHADNDVSAIAPLIERAGYDMVECFVTAPMVPLTLERAREVWGTRVIIHGGLPSLLLAPSVNEEEFRAYVDRLFDIIAPGEAFILGVSDNVMPDSLIDRVAWVSEVVEERGWYPIGG